MQAKPTSEIRFNKEQKRKSICSLMMLVTQAIQCQKTGWVNEELERIHKAARCGLSYGIQYNIISPY
jgi:predicted Zn-ribbon and HTH transcriptional regulator